MDFLNFGVISRIQVLGHFGIYAVQEWSKIGEITDFAFLKKVVKDRTFGVFFGTLKVCLCRQSLNMTGLVTVSLYIYKDSMLTTQLDNIKWPRCKSVLPTLHLQG